MEVKLILTYDILPGRDQDYFEFLIRELAPGLAKLGLEPTESWYTAYGKHPTIMLGGLAKDYATARAILEHPDWNALYERLSNYVTNIQSKIIRATPYFPIV
ncbi:MAG: hypothetical protein CUN49_06655 [Candidatus Thermofonsia Clade 1 bacterium]|jgi:hypothetical protein|uniref:NIPSNAP domain-containing protein n=1 Tax=Candidatus Thermofonsia Clade 1 bacterium TaxID=2364210 RepID=A0A2M8PX84_9CHLR|nr:MAG: hypothetical protein CUN49_06655 [Candidatus Thermofonsia Clade 1 bacterium]PJF42163.1 MAG: hypothetical protein CUN50_05235 [Candidatus Thermofonsia Clade 1 bacterium]RMF50084.1 MAG: hypothetical protein D6749_11575 [Chloroflexota bacterium]